MINLRMKTAIIVVSLFSLCACAGAFAVTSKKPNILLILADDMGYADLSVHGCKHFKTPNIDSIFNGGVRFTNGYVTNSVCAPSRAGLISGRLGSYFGFEANLPQASYRPDSTC
jgi:arylsulfatase A-like enzyme